MRLQLGVTELVKLYESYCRKIIKTLPCLHHRCNGNLSYGRKGGDFKPYPSTFKDREHEKVRQNDQKESNQTKYY